MESLSKHIERYLALVSRRAVSIAEYALIAGLIAVAIVAAVMLLGDVTLG